MSRFSFFAIRSLQISSSGGGEIDRMMNVLSRDGMVYFEFSTYFYFSKPILLFTRMLFCQNVFHHSRRVSVVSVKQTAFAPDMWGQKKKINLCD